MLTKFLQFSGLFVFCILYLLFFSKSNKYYRSKKYKEEKREDWDMSQETADLHDDIFAWFGKVGFSGFAIWCAYELYKIADEMWF